MAGGLTPTSCSVARLQPKLALAYPVAGLLKIPADGADPELTAGGARRSGRARRRASQANSAQQLHRLETLLIDSCPLRIFGGAAAVAAMTKFISVHVGSAAEADCSCSYSWDSNQGWRRCREVPLRVVTVARQTVTVFGANAIAVDCPGLATTTPCAN